MPFKGAVGMNMDVRYDLKDVVDESIIGSTRYIQAADRIAPPVNATQSSGKMPVLIAGDGDRDIDGERASDGSYALLTWKMGDTVFYTTVYGWEIAIDNINDVEIRELIDLEAINARILYDTMILCKEKRVADAVSLYASYGSSNKATNALTAANWFQGTKMWDYVNATIAPRLHATLKVEKWDISAMFPVTFIPKVMRIADVRDYIKYEGNDPNKLTIEKQASELASYLGIKEVIPVSGSYNTTYFNATAPTFSRLWNQSNAIFGILSSGGPWDKSLARQPIYTKPIHGQKYLFESYPLIANDQHRTRLKHIIGEKMDYTCGYMYKGIDAIGT